MTPSVLRLLLAFFLRDAVVGTFPDMFYDSPTSSSLRAIDHCRHHLDRRQIDRVLAGSIPPSRSFTLVTAR